MQPSHGPELGPIEPTEVWIKNNTKSGDHTVEISLFSPGPSEESEKCTLWKQSSYTIIFVTIIYSYFTLCHWSTPQRSILFFNQTLICSVFWPLLAFNLSSHLGVEGVVECGGQWAEWSWQYHGLLGLRLSLVDLEDLPALGEALRSRDQTPQPGCQHRGRGPVDVFTFCQWNCIWIRVAYRTQTIQMSKSEWHYLFICCLSWNNRNHVVHPNFKFHNFSTFLPPVGTLCL